MNSATKEVLFLQGLMLGSFKGTFRFLSGFLSGLLEGLPLKAAPFRPSFL